MSCRKNALLKITLSYLLTRTLSDSKQKIFDVCSCTLTKKKYQKAIAVENMKTLFSFSLLDSHKIKNDTSLL